MNREAINKSVLLLLVLLISAVFLSMIKSFLMAIFLAGIFSALTYPLYNRCLRWFRGNSGMASLTTLLLIVFLVLLPLTVLLGVVTGQAIKVGQSVSPWVHDNLAGPGDISKILQKLPFYQQIEPYRELIVRKVGEMAGGVSRFLLDTLSSATFGTVNFLFSVFVFLYTMFFFLMDGDKLLDKILYYLPLKDNDERRMLDRFTSVSRATLKGTAVIGILQGGLAGLAFWAVGIHSAVFWGAIMIVLSVIPGIGTALIWLPAAGILAVGGHHAKAAGLALFCGVVVGSLDNFLRPALVGKDTQMHELLIFFGTMGGIVLFGVPGIIIGPIIAALFVTVWEIYGVAFREYLPDVAASGLVEKKTRPEPVGQTTEVETDDGN